MRRFENFLGIASLAFFALFGVLAVFILGVLAFKGHDDGRPVPVAAISAAETAAPEAAETIAAPLDQGATASSEPAAPVALASAAPDRAAGEKVFAKCKACHSADNSMQDKVGPHLWGILDRPVGTAEGFGYSDVMAAHGGSWTAEALDAYLADPKGNIPGNKMSFAGLKKPADRANVIAWLAAQSDNPVAPDALSFAAAATAASATTALAEAATEGAGQQAEAAAPEEFAQIAYQNPPEPTQDALDEIAQKIAALEAELPGMDYERARHHPIHYPPMIDNASDGECLVCHQEILDHQVRAESPAGVKANEALAWYQTLDTYVPQDATGQSSFHWRHIESPLAQEVMNLSCNFCHRGNDVREESPDLMPLRAAFSTDAAQPEFTLRKQVNPSKTCLKCHGAMPDPENIMGLGGPWHEVRADMEDQTSDDPTLANGCLSCHAELFRTNRHNVTYLKAANIETLAEAGSDTCYGCHGGRAWYRISFPYPRHPWPGMDPEVPEWAVDRPTESDPRFALPAPQ